MTRLRTDQACLAAQVQQQIAQRLNAELAVPCPDCGAEAGRACQGDFGRSVVTHLARSVASMKRDTEPCPPPEQTPAASACAPVGASAPDADETVLARAVEKSGRPVCKCGQTVWDKGTDECSDCLQMRWTSGDHDPVSLDERIREAQTREPDRVQCAWSSPSGEGESW